MIKKQVFCVLIGMVLFVGCSKPRVEVLEGKEGANFILFADPRDVKISIFKKESSKIFGGQLKDVEYVIQEKKVESTALGNPIFLKLDFGTEYSFIVEKDGFGSEEGDILVRVGEIDNREIYLFTEDELKSKKEENWSESLGIMDWDTANEKCKEVTGRRLPSLRELMVAYNAGITNSWLANGYYSWSSTPYDAERYYALDVVGGFTGDIGRDRHIGVRCRR